MPVSYPTFPLTPNFGNSLRTKAAITRTQYNDGGVIRRALIGINPLVKTISFSVGTDKIAATESFFTNYLGKPCKISFDGGATLQPELYRIKSFSWQYHSPFVRGLTCDIEQVRRFLN